MIHGLQLVNIGCHTNTRLTFGRLTAIVGQNGTGKTTILKSIQQVENLLVKRQNPSELPGLWVRNDVLSEFEESFILASFQVLPDQFEKENGVVRTNLAAKIGVTSSEDKASAEYKTKFQSPQLAVSFGDGTAVWLPESLDQGLWQDGDLLTDHFGAYHIHNEQKGYEAWSGESGPFLLNFTKPLQRIRATECHYLKISLPSLRLPSYSEDINLVLASDASNLASVLADLMTSNRAKLQEVLKALQAVVPSVKDIRATRCPVTVRETNTISVNKKEVPYFEEKVVPGFQLRFDTTTGEDLPASSISDGTLYTLALTTQIVTSGWHTLILIDDIESGLHPSAQRALIGELKQLQKKHSSLQIIVTTHSPYVIDELEAKQVWLLNHAEGGRVDAKRLSDHPRAKEALEVLTTGEFWTSEGESWVTDEPVTAST